ncbi:MAG: hypothetical protein ABI696_10475 [Rubrivivax sp.]
MTPVPVVGAIRWRRWMPWIDGLLGVGPLAWVLRGFELDRFVATLAGSDGSGRHPYRRQQTVRFRPPVAPA